MACDPFWTEAQIKKMVDDYKHRAALAKPRQTMGIPATLALQQIKLKQFKLSGVALPEALRQLHEQITANDQSLSDVSWLIDLPAATSSAVITLDLKDVSAPEALLFVTEIGGVGFEVTDRRIVIGGSSDFRSQWTTPRTRSFPLSDALAAKWFPLKQRGPTSAHLVIAEKKLDFLGVPFGEGARADFVPSMNAICVTNCEVALWCLAELIEESEAELVLSAMKSHARDVPNGMTLYEMDTAKSEAEWIKQTLKVKDGLIDPSTKSTTNLLKAQGIIFPAGSAAWLDRSSKRLHLVTRPEIAEQVRALLAN